MAIDATGAAALASAGFSFVLACITFWYATLTKRLVETPFRPVVVLTIVDGSLAVRNLGANAIGLKGSVLLVPRVGAEEYPRLAFRLESLSRNETIGFPFPEVNEGTEVVSVTLDELLMRFSEARLVVRCTNSAGRSVRLKNSIRLVPVDWSDYRWDRVTPTEVHRA